MLRSSSLGASPSQIYDHSCQLDCQLDKETEDSYVSREENLHVASVLNTFKLQIINREDFREQNLDYFVTARPHIFLSNPIKAHKTICSVSYLGKLESQFTRLRALHRAELFTDCGDQRTCRRVWHLRE